MMGWHPGMRITISGAAGDATVEAEPGITIKRAIEMSGLAHPSTVLAVHAGQTVPQTSVIKGDIEIELIVVSSGG